MDYLIRKFEKQGYRGPFHIQYVPRKDAKQDSKIFSGPWAVAFRCGEKILDWWTLKEGEGPKVVMDAEKINRNDWRKRNSYFNHKVLDT